MGMFEDHTTDKCQDMNPWAGWNEDWFSGVFLQEVGVRLQYIETGELAGSSYSRCLWFDVIRRLVPLCRLDVTLKSLPSSPIGAL